MRRKSRRGSPEEEASNPSSRLFVSKHVISTVAIQPDNKYLEIVPKGKGRTRAGRSKAKPSTSLSALSGKEISRLTKLCRTLTGRGILMPSEDAGAYSAHLQRIWHEHKPDGEHELALTQMLADTLWRLMRTASLESAVYTAGRLRYADLFLDAPADMQRELLDAYIAERSAKQLRMLSSQEGRLRRQYKRDFNELKQLQAERKMKTKGKSK